MKTSALQSINPVTNLANIPSGPNWIKKTLVFSDFSIAAITNSIEVLNLVPKGVIHSVVIKHNAAFTGGLVATATISVGIAGTLAKYAVAASIFEAPAAGVTAVSLLGGCENLTAATSIKATLVTTIANINSLNSGSVDIYLLVSVLP